MMDWLFLISRFLFKLSTGGKGYLISFPSFYLPCLSSYRVLWDVLFFFFLRAEPFYQLYLTSQEIILPRH